MIIKYILDGHRVVPCDNLLEWGKWLEETDRHVKLTTKDNIRVSTVFLGFDHSFGIGPPLLFETMVFGGEDDEWIEQYSTWEEAEEGHERICKAVFAI